MVASDGLWSLVMAPREGSPNNGDFFVVVVSRLLWNTGFIRMLSASFRVRWHQFTFVGSSRFSLDYFTFVGVLFTFVGILPRFVGILLRVLGSFHVFWNSFMLVESFHAPARESLGAARRPLVEAAASPFALE